MLSSIVLEVSSDFRKDTSLPCLACSWKGVMYMRFYVGANRKVQSGVKLANLSPRWLSGLLTSTRRMKLYGILILKKGQEKAEILASQYDLSSFGFFQRGR